MSDSDWFESFFGDDYLEIYAAALPPERTALEVDAVIERLQLERGARVLDLACGHGRHAIPLAQKGLRVTGYDLSASFLAHAADAAQEAGAELRWVRGDMRELAYEAEFDAVLNLFTAFGYFADPRDDVRTLQGVRRALVPGGQLLLETLHRDGLFARFQPTTAERTASGALVFRERDWDLARNVIDERVTLVLPDGGRRHYTSSLRMRSLHEFLQLLRGCGLEPTGWYGGLDGSPLGLHSHRLALVARAV